LRLAVATLNQRLAGFPLSAKAVYANRRCRAEAVGMEHLLVKRVDLFNDYYTTE
jgi:hypothetical protein